MSKNIDELIRLVTEAGGQVTYFGKPVTADELRDKVIDSITRRLSKILTHRCEKHNDGNRCTVCQLPIGIPCAPEPARDTPETAIEVRAAELAAEIETFDQLADWYLADGFDEERRGFSIAETNMQDHTAQWQAGYLARCIATTEDE